MHVVANTQKLSKRIDKREFSAKVIGFDKRTDIAVIKIEASDLAAVKIGNPELLRLVNGYLRLDRRLVLKIV